MVHTISKDLEQRSTSEISFTPEICNILLDLKDHVLTFQKLG